MAPCLVAITWEAGLGEQRIIRSSRHPKVGGFFAFPPAFFFPDKNAVYQVTRNGFAMAAIRSSAISISSARVAVAPMLTRMT